MEYFLDSHQKIQTQFAQVFEQGQASIEADLLKKDGSHIPCFFTGSLLQGDEQQYIVGLGIDITERKHAEAALQASEVKYRSLYSAINEGMALHELIYDEAGTPIDYRILDVNPAFESILGISPCMRSEISSQPKRLVISSGIGFHT